MNIVPSIFKRMRNVMLLVVTMLMLSAQTAQAYTVTAVANPNYGGTVQVRTDNNTEWASSVDANANDKVYFKITAASGYSINGTPNIAPNAGMSITPTYPGVGADPYFTMPADNVTITANFLSSGI